jgi:hypothetical protein
LPFFSDAAAPACAFAIFFSSQLSVVSCQILANAQCLMTTGYWPLATGVMS